MLSCTVRIQCRSRLAQPALPNSIPDWVCMFEVADDQVVVRAIRGWCRTLRRQHFDTMMHLMA